MKVSLNSIRRFNERYGCADDVTKIGVETLIDKVGAQLGGIDEVINLGEKYQGIVVAKIVSCEEHPNADKLNVCTIDDGGNTPDVKRDEQGYVQVVCGAPNVAAGQTVAWLPPGATVPDTVGKDPFVLEARELRGVVSNGMLASPKELALGDSHDGILVIEDDVQPGSDFAEVYGLKDDVVLDIENKMFTHRPDCFGFMGVAREMAGIQGLPFKSPSWYIPNPEFPAVEADELPLTVKNELPELVPRFTAITMRDVQVKASPVWLQVELAKVGVRSINNIVDYTNFFMLETGQPLHAYDYDKVKALSDNEATIVVRKPHKGEKILLLNGKDVEPRAEAVMIATDKQAIGIGGIMGGSETEVDDSTTNIILECANFDMYSIRRTSMAHGLFTDAVTRFSKGQSPLQNLAVLAKIVDEIRQYAGGKVAGQVIDDKHLDETETMGAAAAHQPVDVSAEFINQRLGLNLTNGDVLQILSNVEFTADDANGDLLVQAPFWRTDIEIPEDIVEEVGRLYGYDKLPLELPKRDLTPTLKDPLLSFKAQIRGALAQAGANEVLTYSFVHGDLMQRTGQDKEQAFQISNALSPDLQYYRLSLTPSLLEKVHPNSKAGYDKFALFELGKTHVIGRETEGVPTEFDHLALVFAANKKTAPSGAAYYQARTYLNYLLQNLGIVSGVEYVALTDTDDDQATTVFAPGRAATVLVNGQVIGRIGEYKASVRSALKLPDFVAGFEVGLAPLLQLKQGIAYEPLPRFPKVTQDITLSVSTEVTYQDLAQFVNEAVAENSPADSRSSVEPLDIYQKDGADDRQLTFRLTIANYERTLTDQVVNKLLDDVAAAAKTKFGAERA